MDILIAVLQIAATIGILLLVMWFAWLLKNLKTYIDAQSTIIRSFKAHSEYLKNVQDAVSKLYDPQEIRNLVAVKTESLREQDRSALRSTLNAYMESASSAMMFAGESLVYLSDEQVDYLLERIKGIDTTGTTTKFINILMKDLHKIRKASVEQLADIVGRKN